MALRHTWVYKCTVASLRTAAEDKRDHHATRHRWWASKRDEVFKEIKATGLELKESIVQRHAKTGYLEAETEITVDPELQKKLTECTEKLNRHKLSIDDYSAYIEVMANRPANDTFDLHIDDWKFFFGS